MTTRCGFVALLGAPNAGKSTLLNQLAGAKLSIVSPKAQTTRNRVLGIVLHGSTQLLFVDMPGIFKPRRRLDRAMVSTAWGGVQDADITVLVIDSKSGLTEQVNEIIEALGQKSLRLWVALNKADLIDRRKLLPLTQTITQRLNVEHVFMLSAVTGEGIEPFISALAEALPEGPYLYPQDDLTDLPDRLLAAELVREQIFLQTHQEIPYHVAVETERFQLAENGSVRIDATIFVQRAGHKAILIGEGGKRIRSIGTKARRELCEILERPCHLFLNVKLRNARDDDRAMLRSSGLPDV